MTIVMLSLFMASLSWTVETISLSSRWELEM